MKRIFFILVLSAAELTSLHAGEIKNHPQKRINFLISKRSKKIDPATISFQLQARIYSLLHKKKMYCVFVSSSAEMAYRVTGILKENNSLIGNIWFDSHGHFNRRYSLFEIGDKEFNAETIRDSVFTNELKALAPYCDKATVAGIGSCYGGATYYFSSVETFSEQRMNGDSLMISLSRILGNATVYASEGFVMSAPGIFTASYNLAGFPKKRKFKDPIYKSVWEHSGKWNCYDGNLDHFYSVPTVTINQEGDIYCKKSAFTDKPAKRKKLNKVLQNLEKGNYNISALYQN